jgi:hypothetical protein
MHRGDPTGWNPLPVVHFPREPTELLPGIGEVAAWERGKPGLSRRAPTSVKIGEDSTSKLNNRPENPPHWRKKINDPT